MCTEKKNDGRQVRVVGYLKPKYKNLITDDAKKNDVPVSSIVTKAVEEYYNKKVQD